MALPDNSGSVVGGIMEVTIAKCNAQTKRRESYSIEDITS
jgi:hypothetical protein